MGGHALFYNDKLRGLFVLKAARDARVDRDFLNEIRKADSAGYYGRRKAFSDYFKQCKERSKQAIPSITAIALLDPVISVKALALNDAALIHPFHISMIAQYEKSHEFLRMLVEGYFSRIALKDIYRMIDLDCDVYFTSDDSGLLVASILSKATESGVLLDEGRWMKVASINGINPKVLTKVKEAAVGQFKLRASLKSIESLTSILPETTHQASSKKGMSL